MNLIENTGLHRTPFGFSYSKLTKEHFTGHYHCHQGMEFLYIHQGRGRVIVNHEVHDLRPGMLFYFQPFQLHRIDVELSPEHPYERTLLTFEPTVFMRYFEPFPRLLAYFKHVWNDLLSEQIMEPDQTSHLLDPLIHRYGAQFHGWPDKEKQAEFALLTLHLFQLLHSFGFGSSISDCSVKRTGRHSEAIMQWIEQHYTEPFELDDIAHSLHMSKHYVSRIFRRETGSSITEYTVARKIRQACWLLTTSDKPIERIGIETGFQDFPYFCHIFKKKVGVSPRIYRLREQSVSDNKSPL